MTDNGSGGNGTGQYHVKPIAPETTSILIYIWVFLATWKCGLFFKH